MRSGNSIFFLVFLVASCYSSCQNGGTKSPSERIDSTKFYPAFSKDSLEPVYFNTVSFLWNSYVPESGQAETVQGELIRIIEKLDHEIRGNGKGNWDDPQFVQMANYLKDTLVLSGIFPEEVIKEIKSDIDLLSEYETAYTEEYYYDRLRRRVVEWYWRHKEPIKHSFDSTLTR